MATNLSVPPEDQFECANCLRSISPEDQHVCECHFEHFCSSRCEFAWHSRVSHVVGEEDPRARLESVIGRAKSNLVWTVSSKRKRDFAETIELYLRLAFALGARQALLDMTNSLSTKAREFAKEGWVPAGLKLPDKGGE